MTRHLQRTRDLPTALTQAGTSQRALLCLAVAGLCSLLACGQTGQVAQSSALSGGSGGVPSAAGAGAGGSGGIAPGSSGVGGDVAVGGQTQKGPRLYLEAVAAKDDLYVAAGVLDGAFGSDSVILSSSDATTWNVSYRGGNEVLDSVAYGGGHWVAVGWGIEQQGGEFVRSRSILVSNDGETWEHAIAPECDRFREVVWTGSEFLVRGELPNGAGLWASADGQQWSERLVGNAVPSRLTVGAPGLLGTLAGALALSNDAGLNWSLSGIPRDEAELGARSAVGLWPEADGFGGAGLRTCCYGEKPGLDRYFLLRSEDGLVWDWTQTNYPPIGPVPFTVAQRGERWVGIAFRSGGLLYRDATAPAWTQGMNADSRAVTAGERFVAVGSGIFSSEDGIHWAAAELPSFD